MNWRSKRVSASNSAVPAAAGVYAIGHSDTLHDLEISRTYVYVGKTKNLQLVVSEGYEMRKVTVVGEDAIANCVREWVSVDDGAEVVLQASGTYGVHRSCWRCGQSETKARIRWKTPRLGIASVIVDFVRDQQNGSSYSMHGPLEGVGKHGRAGSGDAQKGPSTGVHGVYSSAKFGGPARLGLGATNGMKTELARDLTPLVDQVDLGSYDDNHEAGPESSLHYS